LESYPITLRRISGSTRQGDESSDANEIKNRKSEQAPRPARSQTDEGREGWNIRNARSTAPTAADIARPEGRRVTGGDFKTGAED
jgi:hypothetical protein